MSSGRKSIIYLFLGGISTGIPSFIGYFVPHPEQTSPFLSFVYSKSALQRGQANISNKSLGIGSSMLFCLLFGILQLLRGTHFKHVSAYGVNTCTAGSCMRNEVKHARFLYGSLVFDILIDLLDCCVCQKLPFKNRNLYI